MDVDLNTVTIGVVFRLALMNLSYLTHANTPESAYSTAQLFAYIKESKFMKQWSQILRSIAHGVEQHFDSLRQRLDQRLDHDRLMIQAYRGYSNGSIVRLRGRVMQDNGISQSAERDTFWQNLLNTYRRFATDEVPYAVIEAQFGEHTTQVTADEEGFFDLQWQLEDADISQMGHFDNILINLRLVDAPRQSKIENTVYASSQVVLPPPNAEYGVISDLDDTVIKSDVANLLKLAKNTFLRNAHTRLPFSGVAAFYRALEKGTGNTHNPFFYVSSSPWNLCDLLTDFLELKQIPSGPLFLQDIGLDTDQWITKEHASHKLSVIEEIMSMYPDLPFLLIGDSTQHDPQIYYEVASRHPDRIRSIYIRDVNATIDHQKKILELASHLATEYSVPLFLADDSLRAAQHAVEIGIISREAIQNIAEETKHDEQPGNTLERLTDEP